MTESPNQDGTVPISEAPLYAKAILIAIPIYAVLAIVALGGILSGVLDITYQQLLLAKIPLYLLAARLLYAREFE